MVRQDRLQKHVLRAHASSVSGKPLAISIKSTQIKINKPVKNPANLQYGEIIENTPTAKFGMTEGSTLGVENRNGQRVLYEQAACSCNGSNDRCIRCDGTGFYAREIIQSTSKKSHDKRFFKSNISETTHESNFSNDYRGGNFGTREIGRFNSNPLYDDHD